jgi:hypothetical protein
VRAIFKVRELILGGRRDNMRYPPPLLDQVEAMGWGYWQSARSGGRLWCRDAAMGDERGLPGAAAARVRGIQGTRLCKDRVDAACRSDFCRRVSLGLVKAEAERRARGAKSKQQKSELQG